MASDGTTVRDLILSVGTHRDKRPLSPLEVANALVLLTNDQGWQGALDRISLGESTARRFLKLRELDPEVAEQVGWGREPGAISFSVATEIGRLKSAADQRALAEAAIEHGLTKDEARQIVQIRLRSRRNISDAITEVVRMRPSTHVIHAVLCAIPSAAVRDALAAVPQRERDELLVKALTGVIGEGRAKGRLTPHNFSVVFQGKQPESTVEPLERDVNEWLEGHLGVR